jgi:hypothetical protein
MNSFNLEASEWYELEKILEELGPRAKTRKNWLYRGQSNVEWRRTDSLTPTSRRNDSIA